MGNPQRVEHEARHQLMAGCDQNCRTTDESSDCSNTRYDRRTNGAWRLPLDRIGILQQGIGDHEQGEARVRQDIEPNRTLEAGAQTACCRVPSGPATMTKTTSSTSTTPNANRL